MVHQLWETAKESLTAYTGLSPATFFKVLAVVFPLYYLVLNLFRYSDDGRARHGGEFEEEKQLLRSPVQLGEITEEELKQYDGSDPKMPLLMAIKGQIYDVSQSRMFYGPGGPYALFSGKDASRALAKVSFEEKDLNGNLTGLSVFELEALQDWEHKFMSKYIKVGTVKTTMRANNGAPEREAREAVKVGAVKTTVRASNGASEREAREAVKVGTVKTTIRASDGAPKWEPREGVKVGTVRTTVRASDGAPKWEPREGVKVGTIRTTVRARDGAPEGGAREAAETDAAKPAEAVSGDVAKLAEDYLWESATKEAEELLVMLRKRSDFLT